MKTTLNFMISKMLGRPKCVTGECPGKCLRGQSSDKCGTGLGSGNFIWF